MRIKDIKVTNKLISGFGIMLLLIIIISAISITQFNDIKSVIGVNQVKISNKDTIKEREVNHLDWALAVINGLANGKADAVDVETDGHKCKFGKWYYSKERMALEKDIPESKMLLVNIEKPHLALHEDVITLKNALRTGGAEGRNTANIIYQDKITKDLKEVRTNLNEINKIIGNNVIKSEESIFDGITVSKTIIIAISIVSLIIGAVIGFFISKSINNPISKCLGIAAKLAEGDLTVRVDLDQADELGQLSKALNDAANGLENLISSVMIGSQNLAGVVEQIASGNQNLSQRTSEQASSLEEIASTIEEATATIKQNAENAMRAQELTDAGAIKSVEGNKVALDAVTSIIDMNDSSKKIADIIAVINEIAFQTNLLALNAAVEAARAGEQGRGFAVVAGEVRNLAQRSGNAAKEIEALIKDTVNKVEKSTELVNRTGGSLNEIAEAAKTTAQIISEIAAASQEQKQGISQINNAIMEMDSTTQQNASLVEETASASEEMANQAQELLEMVRRFKISENENNRITNQKNKKTVEAVAGTAGKQNANRADGGNGRLKKMNTVASIPTTGENDKMGSILKQEGFEEF